MSTSKEGYDCGEIEHYKNDCFEKFVESNRSQNQQQQESEQNVHKEQVQGNKLKQNYIQGWLNNMDLNTSHGAKEVVYGLIVVSSDTAMVLFDPSSSHSFISREYVEEHKITMLPMRKPLIVNSVGGEKKANCLCPKVSLNIKGKNFKANLIVLELMGIDVILGNGWLSACKEVIKYAQRSVLLTTPSGERIEYEGIQPVPKEYENDLLEGASCEDSNVD
ncbi:uncharacterized protein [Miscanthus floridulus]|uniref:uncharacterized protein n=1 Tax=Miscanthus floridulus TaxID=154761 RepID=UPI00345A5A45